MPVRTLPAWPAGRPLRAWQQEAAAAVLAHPRRRLPRLRDARGRQDDLRAARRAPDALRGPRRRASRVVAPTTHICRQWAADAARYGIDLEPNRPNADGPEPRDRHGVAVTYQTRRRRARRCTAAAAPSVPTLLIADEPHHMGEHAAWGRSDAVDAFERRALPAAALRHAVPLRQHADPVGRATTTTASRAPTTPTATREALLDGVCRPVTFHTYDGDMEWMSATAAAAAPTSTSCLPAAEAARRLRTALDPDGDWIAHVLRDADARLRRAARRRRTPTPAGSWSRPTRSTRSGSPTGSRGSPASGRTIVTSDDARTPRRGSRASPPARAPWLVSVLMVSEGVDVPRLRVGVYATTARTELFFRQVVGRFIRRTPAPQASR